jgi:uncharacterized membrane protein
MAIVGFISFLLLIAAVISLILPWTHRGRLNKLEDETAALRRQVNALSAKLETRRATAAEPEAAIELAPAVEAPPIQTRPIDAPRPVFIPQISPPQISPPLAASREQRGAINFERQFGALLPVWIGGVALAFAGFFLVKYSIEQGLLSPAVRTSLGVAFGLALLWAGNWTRSHSPSANGARIAQALTGAGLADLYVSLFAATSLYELLPSSLGFASLAAVTAVAVVLSLRHGAPIAVIGLVGGMLTPALIHSDHPQAAPLFIYLYFLTAGLLTAFRRQPWQALAIPAVLAAFVWAPVWLFSDGFAPADAFWLGAYLIAIKFTVVGLSQKEFAEDAADGFNPLKPSVILNVGAMGGSALLMGLVAGQSGFGAMSWALFGLLAAGSIGLAFFNPRLYGFAPWLSLAVNAVMFAAWAESPGHTATQYAVTLALFGGLYTASGYILQMRSANPLNWALLATTASLGYYLLGYFELRHSDLFAGVRLVWGGLALALAVLSVAAVQRILARTPSDHPLKQHLLASFAGTATAFISIALTVELQHHFLALAFAGQTLALAWINTKVEIKALQTIIAALAGAFVYLMAPVAFKALADFGPVFEGTAASHVPAAVRNPTLYLALPALLFGGSSLLLRRRGDTQLVRALEAGAIALLSATAYFLLRRAFHPVGELLTARASFIERGCTVNLLFILGLTSLWTGERWSRRALASAGAALCGFALLRIGYFDYLWRNPLESHEFVGAAPIANALLLV